jgi:hypothetical protein
MTGFVLGHGAAQEMFDVHRRTWSNWCDHLEVICPEDDSIKTDLKVHPHGLSEHHGMWNCERQRFACELASMHASACIFEYDTLLFGDAPVPTANQCIASGPVWETREHSFPANWFSHSPWTLHKDDYAKIAAYSPTYLKQEYCDRWLAAVCDDLKIAPVALQDYHSPVCGSVNTLKEWHEAYTSAKNPNIKAIHGVKDFGLSVSILHIKRS